MPESCCLRAISRVLEDNGINHISCDYSGRMDICCTAAFIFALSSGYVCYCSAAWLKSAVRNPSAWLVLGNLGLSSSKVCKETAALDCCPLMCKGALRSLREQ